MVHNAAMFNHSCERILQRLFCHLPYLLSYIVPTYETSCNLLAYLSIYDRLSDPFIGFCEFQETGQIGSETEPAIRRFP